MTTPEMLRSIDARLVELDVENILAAFHVWERRRDDALRRHHK